MDTIGLGYTSLPEPHAAASQLVDQAKRGMLGKPTLAILFSTVDYDLDILVGEVQECIGDTPLWGGTSSSGVFTSQGWITGAKGAAALLLVADRPAGVGGALVGSDPLAAAKAAVEHLSTFDLGKAKETGNADFFILLSGGAGEKART